MKKLTKHVLIPAAAFAVTVTGVSAFNESVLTEAGLTDTQIEAFEEARDLRESGDKDAAKETLEDAGIDRDTMKDIRTAMKEHRAEVRAVIASALNDEDYDAFMDAIADTRLADHINDEDDFELFLEAHELRESGDREGAREILDELGIKKSSKPAHKEAKGERGERPQA